MQAPKQEAGTPAATMSKEEHARVGRALPGEPHPWMAAGTLLMNAATLGVGLWLLQGRHWAGPLAAQVLLAVGFFQSFGIMHDCGHGSFSKNRTVSTVVGHLASVFCMLPYFSWKHIHHQHHAWSGHLERDPALKSLSRWRRTGHVPAVARAAWRSWIPVVACIQYAVYWLYPLQLDRRRASERVKARNCALSTLAIIAGYAAIAGIARRYSVSLEILPAVGIYLVLVELVNLPHHTDMPGFHRRLRLWEQNATTRSCSFPPLISEFFVLNFNFHTEHHLYPTLPWYRLRRARRLVKDALGSRYHEAVGLSWNVEKRTRSLSEVALARPLRSPSAQP